MMILVAFFCIKEGFYQNRYTAAWTFDSENYIYGMLRKYFCMSMTIKGY